MPKPKSKVKKVVPFLAMFIAFMLLSMPTFAIKTVDAQADTHCDLTDCYTLVDLSKHLSASDLTTAKALNIKDKLPKLESIKSFNLTLKGNILNITGKIKPGSAQYWTLDIPEVALSIDPWFNSSYVSRTGNILLKSTVSTNVVLPRNITLNTWNFVNSGFIGSDATCLAFVNDTGDLIPFYHEGSLGISSGNPLTRYWFLTTTKADNSSYINVYLRNSSGCINENKVGVYGGYIGAWDMGEGLGTTLDDGSASNKNMELNGGSWTTGMFGNATAYDGSNDYAATSSDYENTALTSWTLGGWFYLINQSNTNAGILTWGDNSAGEGRGILILKENARSILRNDTTEYVADSGYDIPNVWTLITTTWNGTYNNIYIDGTLISSVAIANPTQYSKPVYISRHWGGSSVYVGQYADNVRFSSNAKTSDYLKMEYDTAVRSDLLAYNSTIENLTLATSTSLYLNGLRTNLNVNNSTAVNMTVLGNESATARLYVNGLLSASGTQTATNITTFPIGIYTINGTLSGTGFIESFESWTLNVSFAAPSENETNETTPIINVTAGNGTVLFDIAALEPNLRYCANESVRVDVYSEAGVVRYITCENGCLNNNCKPATNIIALIFIVALALIGIFLIVYSSDNDSFKFVGVIALYFAFILLKTVWLDGLLSSEQNDILFLIVSGIVIFIEAAIITD